MNTSLLIVCGVSICLLVVLLFSGKGSSIRGSHKKGKPNGGGPWIPENLLEEKLEKFRDKEISRGAFTSTLVASEIYFLSSVSDNKTPETCEFILGTGGKRLLCIYTSLRQARKGAASAQGGFQTVQAVRAKTWIPSIPVGSGLVVNRGHSSSVDLLPEDVKRLKLELS